MRKNSDRTYSLIVIHVSATALVTAVSRVMGFVNFKAHKEAQDTFDRLIKYMNGRKNKPATIFSKPETVFTKK